MFPKTSRAAIIEDFTENEHKPKGSRLPTYIADPRLEKATKSNFYIIITPKLPAHNISIASAPTFNTSSISFKKMNTSLRVRGYRPTADPRLEKAKKPNLYIIITPKSPTHNISIAAAPTLDTSSISSKKMNTSLRVRGYRPTADPRLEKAKKRKKMSLPGIITKYKIK